jgi:hypothetical protein
MKGNEREIRAIEPKWDDKEVKGRLRKIDDVV